MGDGQAVINIAANTGIERPRSESDRVLNIEAQFLHVGIAMKDEVSAGGSGAVARRGRNRPGEVKTREKRQKWGRCGRVRCNVGLKSSCRALRGIGEAGHRIARRIE